MKIKFKYLSLIILVLLVSVNLFAKDNYTLHILQDANLPAGKAGGDDSTVTVLYDKTDNGEVDLAYTIQINKTKKEKSYRVCILLPADIKPSISSKDIQGELRIFSDLARDYQTYSDQKLIEKQKVDNEKKIEDLCRCWVLQELKRQYNIGEDTISTYYVCLIDLDTNKEAITNKLEFTLLVPETYKGKEIYSNITSYVLTEGLFSKKIALSPKLFSIKVR